MEPFSRKTWLTLLERWQPQIDQPQSIEKQCGAFWWSWFHQLPESPIRPREFRGNLLNAPGVQFSTDAPIHVVFSMLDTDGWIGRPRSQWIKGVQEWTKVARLLIPSAPEDARSNGLRLQTDMVNQWPPIEVTPCGERFWVINGCRRVYVAAILGCQTLPAWILRA